MNGYRYYIFNAKKEKSYISILINIFENFGYYFSQKLDNYLFNSNFDIFFILDNNDKIGYVISNCTLEQLWDFMNSDTTHPKVFDMNSFGMLRGYIDDKNRPNYSSKKFKKTFEGFSNKILYAFDLDDTLVFSKSFEDSVRPLLNEELTPEAILRSKTNDIGINISDLKYADGRIYFYDPKQKINIPENSTWVRKKDRVYITQPDSYYMTNDGIPIGIHKNIVNIYNNAEYKAIITVRNEKIRIQTEQALKKLGIELPNCGLHMFSRTAISMKSKWKAQVLLDLYNEQGFTQIYYFDDNIKILKKMKIYLKKYDFITLYKVNENNYRKI